MVSHSELDSDPPIGSDRETGRDIMCVAYCVEYMHDWLYIENEEH